MSNPDLPRNFLRRYPLALGCAAVCLLLATAYIVRRGTLTGDAERLAQLESEGRNIERDVRNAGGLEEHTATLKQGVARLEKRLIRADDIAGTQEYFYGLEKASGVTMTVLRPLGVSKAAAAASLYRPAGFNVVVEGEYSQLCGFLRSLESGLSLYRLVDFSVQRASTVASAEGTGQREVLTINFQLLAAK